MKQQPFLHLLMAAALLAVAGCGREEVTGRPWREFVNDLTDVSRIADLDTQTARLVSSYDRRGGNDDFNYYIRQGSEPGWVVLAEFDGPGCIRRFWTTGADFGHPYKIYFDGEKKPRISGKVEDVFGGIYPFEPPLARYLNLCWWSYVPLTFNESIRIETLAPPVHPFWGQRRLFFQLNVEQYDKSFAVQTFPKELSEEDEQAVTKAAQTWSKSVEWPDIAWDDLGPITIEPGASETVFSADTPGTIRTWDVKVEPADPSAWTQRDREYLLQDALLRVTYDGGSAPSIDVPLGDFFLNGWRERHYGSLLMGSCAGGYHCALPLPFKKSIDVTVANDSDKPILVRFKADVKEGAPENMGYLHTAWNKSGPDKGPPHRIADFEGRGKFVGCFLGVTGLDQSWWILEGDETMYIDGATRPSWHGTGLEDYFNGGWYYRGAAFSALHGIFDRSPFRTAQYRFQLVDSVNFDSSLRMEIERGDQSVSRGYMKSVAYAYLAQPRAVQPAPAERETRRGTDHPILKKTFMLQLVELERMNNYRKALDYCREYAERFPEDPETGIYLLRALEYRRLLGEQISDSEMEPFLNEEYGKDARNQAKLLSWFYEKPGRALVGMNVNGQGFAYLDGKVVLTGDHPYNLFVTGVELPDGPHTFGAKVTMTRNDPWLQLGIRTADGVTGTGPGTYSTRDNIGNWSTAAIDPARWDEINMDNVPRGIPDAPYIGGIPNAFVLLQSKAYGVRMPDWGHYQGTAFFREDFTSPLAYRPDFTPRVTGLSE